MSFQPSKVASFYGAPMGRRTLAFIDGERLFAHKVRLNSGGYDDGGAYWGTGAPLWRVWSKSGGEYYTRALDRTVALMVAKAHGIFIPAE